MVDRPLNEQHEWGGRTFRATSTFDTGGQTLLAGRPAADTDPSQVPFTASSSDNLFAPVTNGPSSFHPYILPHVPDPYDPRRFDNHTPSNLPHPSLSLPRLPRRSLSHTVSPRIHPLEYRSLPPLNHPPPVFPHNPYPPHPSNPPLYHHSPPIQYVYLPAPPSDTSLTPSSKSLPVISSIHSLNSKSDFYAWDEGVCTLLRLLGIHGHVIDPTLPVDPLFPDSSPALPPALSQPPTAVEMKALTRWRDNDNIAQYVLVGRLGALARQLLPPASMSTRTAFAVYTTLTRYFGLRNFADCDELATSLLQSRCEHNRVQDYVARWRAGVARLSSARFPFSIHIFINAFVKSLPNTITFATLRATLPDRLSSWDDSSIGPLITVTNEVMDLEVAFRHSSQSHSCSAPQQPSLPPQVSLTSQPLAAPPSTQVPPSSVQSAPPRAPRQTLSCNNCKDKGFCFTGHTDGTCFQPGGGMEGHRDEYMSNKGCFHAMFVECLDNASLCDSSMVPDVVSPSSPDSLPVLDDEIVLPPLANLCIATSAHNFDLRDDLYIPCFPKFFPFACASIDFQSAAMVSMVSLYNALLDSGCTHHIIRDRSLFSSYTAHPVSVGTANCGSLEAFGSGDVEFRYPYRDRHVVFTLRGVPLCSRSTYQPPFRWRSR